MPSPSNNLKKVVFSVISLLMSELKWNFSDLPKEIAGLLQILRGI